MAELRRMIGAVSFEFDNPTLQESYSTFQNLSAQAKAELNGTIAFTFQPFTRSAVQKTTAKGGNLLGLAEVTQACRAKISLSTSNRSS